MNVCRKVPESGSNEYVGATSDGYAAAVAITQSASEALKRVNNGGTEYRR